MLDRRLFLAGALASVAACTADRDASHLNIGVQRNGILYIARQRGKLERRLKATGVTIAWVEFPSGPPMIEAIGAGAIDFGAVGDTPVIYAQAAGVDLRLVAAQVYAQGGTADYFLTLPASPVADAAALRGRRIGFTKGSSAEVAALTALQSVGLSVADVTPVTLAPGDGVAALGEGSVDALFTWDPYFSIAESRLAARANRYDRAGLLSVSLFVARGPVAAAPAAALVAQLNELTAEAAWANGHRDEVRVTLARAARMPEAEIERSLARLGPSPFEVTPPSPAVVANQQRVAEVLRGAGAIAAALDTAQVIWRGWHPA